MVMFLNFSFVFFFNKHQIYIILSNIWLVTDIGLSSTPKINIRISQFEKNGHP